MDYLLWLCSLVVPVVLAVEETLMDSRWATTELAWTTFPESGWEEVSGYDDSMSPIRTYQVCNVRQPNQNNWLRTDFIPRKGVLRVYVELKFSVRDCASIPNIPGSCKETFNLFYYESEGDTATETSPLWRESPYVKVDTIAPDESFSLLEAGRINTKVRSFGPLSKAGFYLAFQDLGACMSLISVRVFFKKCSTTIANFAVFPETATGAEATSLVIAPGACVTNAMEVSVPLKLYCNGDGEWMVPVGSCTCVAGFEPSADDTQCLACIPGTFKSKFGEGSCTPCPSHSRTSARGANICPCQSGFYRADSDPPDSSCTSNPQKSVQDQLPLIIGSASAGLVVIVALVVIAVVCLKKQRSGSELEYTEKLQQYISPGVKVYIDPFTYEDPNDAVHEFAKEIDISCVKIEEVIGAAQSATVQLPRDSYQRRAVPQVMTAVEQDYRLPPPMDCPMVLHQLMLECWMKERNLRPKFSHIVSTLDKLLRNAASLKVVTSTYSGDLLRLGGTLPGHNRKSPEISQEIVRQQMSQTLPIRV
ncbi:Ephrin type-B receptor 3 [Liparis tanakae]|uniref:receptor protein-tyrosine kinase n=1 Tax=Liparis tanakae TaxID=230148 RepID=A0A4Z2GMA3_9TELE|nr:Ephrin type-B receptor 3 [Liparis tanakae]